MNLTLLKIRQFRCLLDVQLELAPGLNVITGANGAGKSSIIEAVHLLGYGRSFRGRVADGLIQTGAAHLEVYAEWLDCNRQAHRAGLRHSGNTWEARLDGAPAPSLTELCARIAVVCFEPGSHNLIAGGSEHRRRHLDWGLFHVEQNFLPLWRRYARTLKQRNVLLKSGPPGSALAPWDRELADAGEALTRMRLTYLERLEPFIGAQAQTFLGELGELNLGFRPGWRRAEMSLSDALLLNRERDIAQGHTSQGPHRADWTIGFSRLPGREALSRGQEKLAALACILGQASDFAAARQEWPVICLDDLASELDQAHQQQVLTAAITSGAQVLLSGTRIPDTLAETATGFQRFHVEHGALQAL